MKRLLSAAVLTAIALPASAQSVTWNWLSPNFAACEGVGIHGTYRVYVRAEVQEVNKQAKKIVALSVYAGSGALQQNKGELSGKVSIEKGGTVQASAALVRQPPNSIAESPKSDETPRMFLPNGKVMDVPAEATVKVEVSVAIKTDSGSCSLGSTSNSHDLFK